MICKTFEIRDTRTFIPVLAVKLEPGCEKDRYLLARAGYGPVPLIQAEYVMLCDLKGGEGVCSSDPYQWHVNSRTYRVAHSHISKNFDALESGSVVDIQFLLNETLAPKQSEAEEQLFI